MAFYFAYGTLLDVDEMRRLCPSAKPVGVMELDGYELAFVTCSDGKNGGCTLNSAPRTTLYGLQWQLPDDELAALDEAAGVSAGLWEHQLVTVADENGNLVDTITYRIPADTGPIAPTNEYVRPILAGARQLNLPDRYIARLEEIIAQAQAR